MIGHYTEHENNIIACALEYWAYPCHKYELIEALECWAWAMDLGGKETDPIDLQEGKDTRVLIKKLKKELKVKYGKKLYKLNFGWRVWHRMKLNCVNSINLNRTRYKCRLTGQECMHTQCPPLYQTIPNSKKLPIIYKGEKK